MKTPHLFSLPLVLFMFFVILFTLCVCPEAGWSEEMNTVQTDGENAESPTTQAPASDPAKVETPSGDEASDYDLNHLRHQIEAEKLKAELERARAETEKARAEAEQARLDARIAKKDNGIEDDCPDLNAEEKAREKEKAYRHDGFFLRMGLGFGVAGYNFHGKIEGDAPSLYARNPSQFGPAIAGSLMLGGAIKDNLILHADIWSIGHVTEREDEKVEGFSVGVVGLGVTYYFMPTNLYITASVGPAISGLTLVDTDNDKYEVDALFGLGASLALGKEWWVSENWGLGLALRGNYAYTANRDLSGHQGGTALMFTATYN